MDLTFMLTQDAKPCQRTGVIKKAGICFGVRNTSFVGYIELSITALRRSDNYKTNTSKGVAVEYISRPAC